MSGTVELFVLLLFVEVIFIEGILEVDGCKEDC